MRRIVSAILSLPSKYSMAVPFTERFFDLALTSEDGRCGTSG